MATEDPLVTIILSTFNGEHYLEEQLISVFQQSYKPIKIIVRDDGSQDGTVNILNRLKSEYSNLEVFVEKNIGVVASFLKLLEMVPSETEYVALCDQDDVWYEDKIERAVFMINECVTERPVMYLCAQELVDKDLKQIGYRNHVQRNPSFENALLENIATGCTAVLNKAALELMRNKEVHVNEIKMHDWWLYQVITAFGFILYDKEAKIKYRQHSGNLVGSTAGFKLWLNRIKIYVGTNKKETRCQLNELMRVYGSQISCNNHKLVKDFLINSQSNTFFERLKYAVRTPLYRQKATEGFIFRVVIVLGRI